MKEKYFPTRQFIIYLLQQNKNKIAKEKNNLMVKAQTDPKPKSQSKGDRW